MEKEINRKALEYADKVKELGTHTNALVSLHLRKPEEFDKVWLFDKLISKYKELGLDVDNVFDWDEEE